MPERTIEIIDARGRTIVTVNPTAPHTLVKYDNLGRATAVSQYVVSRNSLPLIVETDYDLAGRVTARRVTKKRDITDGAVLRIGTAYDQLGRVDTVTQYDDVAGAPGDEVDQVKYPWRLGERAIRTTPRCRA